MSTHRCSVKIPPNRRRACKTDVITVLKKGFPLPLGEGRMSESSLSTINSSLIRVFDPPSLERRRNNLIFPGKF
jgi:hypothetical protein